MKPPIQPSLLKIVMIALSLACALPVFSQKHKPKNDSLAVRDSIREMMFKGALLSMDALQAKYEAQKSSDSAVRHQKSGESQNLFFQSRAYYRKAIGFDKNYYPAWTSMGTTYYLQDLPKASIPCYHQALLINNDFSPAWYNLGKSYDAIGKKDSAIYSFKQSIRSDSSFVQAYQEWSRVIMANEKDTAAALKLLRLSAYYKPASEVPWVSMSEIYLGAKDTVNAMLSLESAAKIFPSDLNRLQKLGDYYRTHGDPQKAKYYLDVLTREKKKQEIEEDPHPGE